MLLIPPIAPNQMVPHEPAGDYPERQAQHDRTYAQAWRDAPQDFKDQVAQLGLDAEVDEHEGDAREYNDNLTSSSHTPDLAQMLDDYVDQVIEKHGNQHAILIRLIAADLKKPMEEELVRNRSMLLGRVSCYLISDEKGNMRARLHALLHSIPRLAIANGYPSLRSSAKHCGVSAEWLRRARDKWCENLGIPAPTEGTKTAEAKAKYSQNGLSNHWRNQKFHASKPTTEGNQKNGN